MTTSHLQKGRAIVGPAPRGQQGPQHLTGKPNGGEQHPARGPGKNNLAPAGALGVGTQGPLQPATQVGNSVQQTLNYD